ncbi:MAG: 4Fe-4S binding protein, partial [Candidatus Thiodiazotropha weberae]|nr:4Fe-4S binding protein [Candidatus Thiodiazotropha lotti]MCW4212426.1 4Fe-4S binding protein [Candidatus Thiodiazotropha lotti]
LLDDDDDYDDDYGDDDDGFSDDTAMVMSLKNTMDCIGCGSCARICPKKCFTHQPQTVAA